MTDRIITIEPDDDLRAWRRVFLGPNGSTLLWQASYVAYGVFSVLALIGLWFIIAVLNHPWSITLTMYVFLVCVLLTRGVMKLTDTDTPLRALPQMAVHTAKAGKTTETPREVRADTRLRVVSDPWEPVVQADARRAR